MKTSKRIALPPAALFCGRLLGAGLIGALLVSGPPAGAQTFETSRPWIMPFDVDQPTPGDPIALVTKQRQLYDFMWQTFVAVNWPQKDGGNRAEPDSRASLAPWNSDAESEGPVVWQSYRRPNEVFLEPRQWPIRWNDPPPGPVPVCPAALGLDPLTISSYSTNYSDYADGLNQPYIQANYPTGPVTDQNGNYLRYEVGLNQSYFTYIGRYRYFDPAVQQSAVERFVAFATKKGKAPKPSNRRNAKHFQPLPNGAEAYLKGLPDYARQGIVEWKSAWKVLDGDDVPERFYRRYAYFLNPDGSCTGPFKVGLVALHLHRVTRLGHIGTTFEQVDNTTLQPAYSSKEVPGAADLPSHASLNPAGSTPANYPNGYEVCNSNGKKCKAGVGGSVPTPLKDFNVLPLDPSITNISRQVPIPDEVQAVNAQWRKKLKGTVWFYYQMIGTQNPNVQSPNPHLGPGVRGAQVSSTNNLINAALESYTQEGWSCAQCHQNAFPQGVTLPLPSFGPAFDPLHTISFLLQNAVPNSTD